MILFTWALILAVIYTNALKNFSPTLSHYCFDDHEASV